MCLLPFIDRQYALDKCFCYLSLTTGCLAIAVLEFIKCIGLPAFIISLYNEAAFEMFVVNMYIIHASLTVMFLVGVLQKRSLLLAVYSCTYQICMFTDATVLIVPYFFNIKRRGKNKDYHTGFGLTVFGAFVIFSIQTYLLLIITSKYVKLKTQEEGIV